MTEVRTGTRLVRFGGVMAAGMALVAAGCDDGASDGMPDIETAQASEAVPTCDSPPDNGAVLARDETRGTGPHTVEIASSGSGNTIVNVRDGSTNDLVVSFYVEESQTAKVEDVPDGQYRIQYATGADLAEDCRSFAVLGGATQDPEIVDFPAGSAMTLTYELTPVADGNFEGQSIDPGAFAAD